MSQGEEGAPLLFFSLSDWLLIVVLFAIIFGATIAGLMAGRRLHHRSDKLREPMATMQAAVLGFMALILAFGLSLAVGRYQDRRASVVEEANAIGTTYLRAQTLAEPVRSRSLDLLVRYTDASIRFAQSVPDSASARRALRRRKPSSNVSCGHWRVRPSMRRRLPARRVSTWTASTP